MMMAAKNPAKKADKYRVKKAVWKAPAKFYMVGDISYFGSPDRYRVGIPGKLLVDYLNAVIVDAKKHDEEEDSDTAEPYLKSIKKLTCESIRKVVYWTTCDPDDAKKVLKAIKTKKSCGTGETEIVAGWGATMKLAQEEYDGMQDSDYNDYDCD
jgi:hypothetical protein